MIVGEMDMNTRAVLDLGLRHPDCLILQFPCKDSELVVNLPVPTAALTDPRTQDMLSRLFQDLVITGTPKEAKL